jgi:quinoprotein glucose dehydrogenase
MSADEELGYVYLPISTPTNDYYGGHRPGDGLYGDSLVCIEAATGKKIWHYQLIRHGLWDYDTPAAPNLIDITVAGQRIKAVAQVSKQALSTCSTASRANRYGRSRTGRCPPPALPGECASQTQPFPTRPAPIDIQGVSEEDIIDLTGELRREALELRPTVHASLPARHHPGSRCRRGCQLVRCCHRSRNWHTLCWDLPPALRRNCLQAEIL